MSKEKWEINYLVRYGIFEKKPMCKVVLETRSYQTMTWDDEPFLNPQKV